MKKIFLLSLLFIFLTGCSLNTSKEKSSSSVEPNLEQEEKIGKGMISEEFQTELYETIDWSAYSFLPENPKFTLQYPENRAFDGTIFYYKNTKVAEFSPGVVKLQEGQKCFDVDGEDLMGTSELISKTAVENGMKKISKIYTMGQDSLGEWYGHSYCIERENMAFVMTFYEYDIENRQQFYDIASSFNLLK